MQQRRTHYYQFFFAQCFKKKQRVTEVKESAEIPDAASCDHALR
jgi:hypothetical protein